MRGSFCRVYGMTSLKASYTCGTLHKVKKKKKIKLKVVHTSQDFDGSQQIKFPVLGKIYYCFQYVYLKSVWYACLK